MLEFAERNKEMLKMSCKCWGKTAGIEKTGGHGADLFGLLMSKNKEHVGVDLKSNASVTTEEF